VDGFPGHCLRTHCERVVEADELGRALGEGDAMALHRGAIAAGDRPGEGVGTALSPVRRGAEDQRGE
jgi:hypothetical protein